MVCFANSVNAGTTRTPYFHIGSGLAFELCDAVLGHFEFSDFTDGTSGIASRCDCCGAEEFERKAWRIARIFSERIFYMLTRDSPVHLAVNPDMHRLLSKDAAGRAVAFALGHGLPGGCGESGLLAVENIPAGLRGPETARRKDIFSAINRATLPKERPRRGMGVPPSAPRFKRRLSAGAKKLF
jgi:hypothetical protein